ncbi:MAG: hypothetical protein IKL46_07310 [Clostridia bacterium]|nr:hypothetical protein [Clostridia bacterium]MBR6564317.1 hypothetical protein [Clostridia bacterium]
MKINTDKKKLKTLMPVAVLVLLLIIATISLFIRPNLEMDDIKAPQKMSVLMQYGFPTDGFSGDKWEYVKCIKFHGVEVRRVEVDFNKKEITFYDHSEDNEIADVIEHYADLKEDRDLIKTYAYDDMKIEVCFDDMIEFKFY